LARGHAGEVSGKPETREFVIRPQRKEEAQHNFEESRHKICKTGAAAQFG